MPVHEELHRDLGVDVKAQHAETSRSCPRGLLRAAPLCPPSLPRTLLLGRVSRGLPARLSPSPNPIHLPSPAPGSSSPRRPPLTQAPGTLELSFSSSLLHPPRTPQTLKQGPRLLPPKGDRSNALPGPWQTLTEHPRCARPTAKDFQRPQLM